MHYKNSKDYTTNNDIFPMESIHHQYLSITGKRDYKNHTHDEEYLLLYQWCNNTNKSTSIIVQPGQNLVPIQTAISKHLHLGKYNLQLLL